MLQFINIDTRYYLLLLYYRVSILSTQNFIRYFSYIDPNPHGGFLKTPSSKHKIWSKRLHFVILLHILFINTYIFLLQLFNNKIHSCIPVNITAVFGLHPVATSFRIASQFAVFPILGKHPYHTTTEIPVGWHHRDTS